MPVWPKSKRIPRGEAGKEKVRWVSGHNGSREYPILENRAEIQAMRGLCGLKFSPPNGRPRFLRAPAGTKGEIGLCSLWFVDVLVRTRKIKPEFLRGCFPIIAALLWLSPVAQAEFKITDVQSRVIGEALVVSGKIDFGLTPKVEEALSKGIELSMVIEVRLYRKRPLLWDHRLATWSLRRNLQYHALSGQYLVGSGNTRDNFRVLAEALNSLGLLRDLRLPLAEIEITTDDDYIVRLRAHLDIEALPAPLRPVAYTTLSWHLNSGWTTWNVAR